MLIQISVFIFIQLVKIFPIEFSYFPNTTTNNIEECPVGFRCYTSTTFYD